jgi:hypothetical protein
MENALALASTVLSCASRDAEGLTADLMLWSFEDVASHRYTAVEAKRVRGVGAWGGVQLRVKCLGPRYVRAKNLK